MKTVTVRQFGHRIKAAQAGPGETLALLALPLPKMTQSQALLLSQLGGLVAAVNIAGPEAQVEAVSEAMGLVAAQMTGPIGQTLSDLADALSDGHVTPVELLELAGGQLQGPAGQVVQSLARILEDNKIDRHDVGPALSMAFALTALVRR